MSVFIFIEIYIFENPTNLLYKFYKSFVMLLYFTFLKSPLSYFLFIIDYYIL